ncbi:polysaccharide deacetylase family protein [Agromyces salentinus]|uniref:Polysaccharide deacetylase family protein n=1 Tax=Agromyces salentinus TaxID=269421 RepID=A0ABN2MZU8_9MICO|nr:polysaccharide deacetylase family protein [Agromyces salentinus]
MRVTLTFDNGPHPTGTPIVLDALQERNIHAVFFVVGHKVHAHPELVARMSDGGHLVGNHTWSHSVPFGDVHRAGYARSEIVRTQHAIVEIAPAPQLFRPVGAAPGAVIDHRLLNEEAVQTLFEGGYTMALWNVVPRDWQRPDDWIEAALEGCRGTDEAVVVLHDGHPAGMALLPAFLDALIDEAAQFRTDFPASCTPIRAGTPGPGLAELVSSGPNQRTTPHSPHLKEQS